MTTVAILLGLLVIAFSGRMAGLVAPAPWLRWAVVTAALSGMIYVSRQETPSLAIDSPELRRAAVLRAEDSMRQTHLCLQGVKTEL